MASADYLIWSDEHRAWWGPGGHGYVASVAEAGRYTREQALGVSARAVPGAGRNGRLPELPVRLADVMAMREAYRNRFNNATYALELWDGPASRAAAGGE